MRLACSHSLSKTSDFETSATFVFETRAFPRNRCLPSIRVSAPILATASPPIRPISNHISHSASCCRTAPRLTSQNVFVSARFVLGKPFRVFAPFAPAGLQLGVLILADGGSCAPPPGFNQVVSGSPNATPTHRRPPVWSCCGAAVRPPVPQPWRALRRSPSISKPFRFTHATAQPKEIPAQTRHLPSVGT